MALGTGPEVTEGGCGGGAVGRFSYAQKAEPAGVLAMGCERRGWARRAPGRSMLIGTRGCVCLWVCVCLRITPRRQRPRLHYRWVMGFLSSLSSSTFSKFSTTSTRYCCHGRTGYFVCFKGRNTIRPLFQSCPCTSAWLPHPWPCGPRLSYLHPLVLLGDPFTQLLASRP